MTLTAVEQCGRETSISAEGEITGQRVFIVTSADRLSGFELMLGLPSIGDRWPDTSVPLYCESIRASEQEQLTGGWALKLTAHYSFTTSNDGEQPAKDPLLRNPVYSWLQANQIDNYLFKDLDNKWFINTAGDLYDPPPPIQVIHPILQVRRNYHPGFWDALKILNNTNAANSDTYQGASPGYARIMGISVGEPKYDNFTWYREAIIHIEFRNEYPWTIEYVLSEGPRHRENGKLVYNTDANNVPSTFTHLLNPSGGLLVDPNNPPADFSTVTPHYKTYRMRKTVSFSSLGL